jgi:hypothetical protein
VIEDRLFRIRNSSVLAWTRNNGLRGVDQQEPQQGPHRRGGTMAREELTRLSGKFDGPNCVR